MRFLRNLTAVALLLFLSNAFYFSKLYAAEKVKAATYVPSPYGSYRDVLVRNEDESADILDFTQGLTKAGINISTEYPASPPVYTPGIFWSTLQSPTKPKAGIWMYENTNESRLYFGTSNDFATGITNTMVLDKNGGLGIGLTPTVAPVALLDVNGVGAHAGGTASAPGFAIRSDLDTGMYTVSPNTLSFSTGGTQLRVHINSAGNVGVDTTYTAGAAPNSLNGNVDVNDMWVRNGNQWLGQVGVSAAGPGWAMPDQAGTYTGSTATGNNRFIATTFRPTRVVVWARNGGLIELSETWAGLVIQDTSIPAADRPNSSFHIGGFTNVSRTYLRIALDTTTPDPNDYEQGFRVGGTVITETNMNGIVYYWYAWN